MVNLMPVEPRPTDDAEREWLLKRLDFMRTLVESGAPCAIEDGSGMSQDGRQMRVSSFVFYEADWLRLRRSPRTLVRISSPRSR